MTASKGEWGRERREGVRKRYGMRERGKEEGGKRAFWLASDETVAGGRMPYGLMTNANIDKQISMSRYRQHDYGRSATITTMAVSSSLERRAEFLRGRECGQNCLQCSTSAAPSTQAVCDVTIVTCGATLHESVQTTYRRHRKHIERERSCPSDL